jgi:bifunctional DNase/RNase
MEEFYIKSIVGGGQADDSGITLYLFNQTKTLAIPLKLKKDVTDALLLAQQNTIQQRPFIHDTLDRLIKSLGGKVVDIYVYMLVNGIYYSYLRLFANGRSVEVDIKFSDGLCTAIKTKCPILFEDTVLKSIALNLATNGNTTNK